MAVHFVGFKDSGQYWRATQVFGKPDFIHRLWDVRAKFGGEYDPETDVMVFATGDETQTPTEYSWNDSERF